MNAIKKIVLVILGTVAVGSVILVSLKYTTANASGEWANLVDQLNPFVRQTQVYVKTTDPVSVNGYGTATYQQEAVTEDGNTRPIEFNGLSVLKVDHYLKLTNKGAHVITYEEVSEQSIPAAVLNKLKKY